MTSALILIDLMPRIVALPLAPHSGEEVLARCRRLADAFRAGNRPVVLVRVERPNVSVQPPGSGFAEDLARPGDVLVVKRTVGAFHGTGLDDRLRALGVDTLVFAGLVTTMGVESTARAASDHGYEVEFVADAMSGFEAEEHDFSVKRIFPRFGAVRDTGDYT
ncbi:isochorismatase family protein [Streptomyces antarcticus]|uniref:isochorismatase family protein n=1 Tax=Streptomyces antarcticus TaxID=2996458 RepID=UPI002270EB44|nr:MULTISPECIES: isochorismatase family protein [unclassified Streptomyces]MCY0943733.1 isochorismatase family protein [Streptomyces sp. H34-AA3]MCY0954166.1 isochorismatase family protein [Streptomyces sp. H27-S2]MCZ4086358.1 isochorismatase family protein [Streptomyces sp. H34-S5]